MKRFLSLMLLFSSLVFASSHEGHGKHSGIRKIVVVNFDHDGVKQWRPGTIAGYKGETIELTLKNTAKAPHGYAIKELGVKEVIKAGETKTIKFKVSKPGIHRINCQMHKAHVGGQFIAL